LRRPRLFDLVALGGTAVTRARFGVRILNGPWELPPRSLLLVTHRSDWDIPLTTNVYWSAEMWKRDPRLVFVARDDMFLPGFLGGYPPSLPLRLRRVLEQVNVGGVLGRASLALPIASATRAHLVHVALDEPALPVDVLPADAVAAVQARARRLGRPQPLRLEELLEGDYLDLLWRRWHDRGELPGLDGFWGRRQAAARRDFEALLAHVESGGTLAIYPEGHPSPDGAIGPLERGLGVLVRRAKPDALVPVGLAYDPLARGRPRAYVAVGGALPAAPHETEAVVLDALRRTMPLTPGQVAAHALLHGLDPRRVADEALQEDRPREPRLRGLVDGALEAAGRAPRPVLERLDLEFRSARGAA
jgi:hypothetical protein